ncbi:signal transduction histidine kinase [Sphingobacterium allocomposti]|uniref:Sensory/regulatory protein RpfC n=1 Tax=Sphingobacterium allocomposti TaxID=415956 RepID=A0A5S5DUC1_9SPHI|nr:response regulator [Sphingobacterium composti Yoo et al. 2007 non Ten et al. 2007]TYP98606.1 signal transduction histidine kinase [Sphingobacterium composti Yoo et al. 2007 non Ten et al. 2007]
MKNVNLLILDDKEENIISLAALLSEIPHINIISSTDPNEALKICWKNDIAIALVDVQMPEINGFEFVSLLKSNPRTNHITAIMVTAISKEDKYLLKGLESGAVDYLYKPLNPEITVAKVTSFVKQIHIQEEIKQKNIALEESRRALIMAKEEAEEARKSKESFLANMSHEIRTPINGIVGIIHMLRNSELNNEQRDWINRLDSASSSLLLIINDILDISKIDSGMMKIENENFSIRKKLIDINNIFTLRARDKNLIFEMDIDPALPEYINSDPLRIQQIINNFISNSLKFTETGKITLKIKVVTHVDDQYTIRFTVIDTGIGIKDEAIEKIFLAFEQGDDGITKKFGGTGLGLAIVKRLADLLNGKVEARSVYGKGSEFSFEATFQRVEDFPNEEKIDKTVFSKLERFHNVRILVAEDNDLNSFMLAHMLESWGCRVDIAKNGRQAVENVSQQDYDLIMMDTHMPVMSGFEAIKEIKKNASAQKAYIPIITISASVLEHEQARAYEVGADSVIGKPFDPLDLHQKITQLLSKKNLTWL